MPNFFRAIAVDYDGTLTDQSSPNGNVLEAIANARGEGRCVILVTGRRLEDLRTVFPTADRTFDSIVAENGAVLWSPALGVRAVAQPVPLELDQALAAQGVTFARGQVILGTEAVYDQAVLQEVARLGLEVQLVRNRAALMVLPPGVSKGTGLLEALADLGLSHHSTIGVGDAENDHSLLETCELGVAVANAVPALLAHADVVLGEAAGEGVVSLLGGPLLRGEIRVQPSRWQARIGSFPDGTPATIPGSQANLLIAGGTQSGKSCLAGLLAERLIGMGYSICVVDPEGDHGGLEVLRGVMVLSTDQPVPGLDRLDSLLRRGSVVVDLSLRPHGERAEACRQVLSALAALRERSGLPHWVILDEAQLVPEVASILSLDTGVSVAGICLVTYCPGDLRSDALQAMDLAVALPGEGASDIEAGLAAAGFAPCELAAMAASGRQASGREALLLDRRGARQFTVDQRASSHVRHWHKYLRTELPFHRRFFFRRRDQLTGAVSADLIEFHHQVGRADAEVLRHHARNHDFSRWVDGVIRDQALAGRIREAERQLASNLDPEVEEGRRVVLHHIELRYTSPAVPWESGRSDTLESPKRSQSVEQEQRGFDN